MTRISANRLAELLAHTELTQLQVAAISGIHPDVPAACINTYPTGVDNLLRYKEAAVGLLLLQHPIGVTESGNAGKYSVVTGLDAWRALAALKLQPEAEATRGRPKKVPERTAFESIPVVVYRAPHCREDIQLLAHADLWLKLAALNPDRRISDMTMVRAHELVGNSLLRILTPDIASLRSLASFLGQRSHSALTRHRRARSPSPEPEAPAETVHDRPDPTA